MNSFENGNSYWKYNAEFKLFRNMWHGDVIYIYDSIRMDTIPFEIRFKSLFDILNSLSPRERVLLFNKYCKECGYLMTECNCNKK